MASFFGWLVVLSAVAVASLAASAKLPAGRLTNTVPLPKIPLPGKPAVPSKKSPSPAKKASPPGKLAPLPGKIAPLPSKKAPLPGHTAPLLGKSLPPKGSLPITTGKGGKVVPVPHPAIAPKPGKTAPKPATGKTPAFAVSPLGFVNGHHPPGVGHHNDLSPKSPAEGPSVKSETAPAPAFAYSGSGAVGHHPKGVGHHPPVKRPVAKLPSPKTAKMSPPPSKKVTSAGKKMPPPSKKASLVRPRSPVNKRVPPSPKKSAPMPAKK